MALRAVVFDFFGTLTISTQSNARNTDHAEVADALGVSADAYMKALNQSWPDRARGRLGGVEDVLRWIARTSGVEPTDEAVRLATDARRRTQRGYITIRPEAVPTLRELKARGLAIGLVSDCTQELVERWPQLDVAPYVDVPVFSVVEGVKKPDPVIFRTVCERLQVEPGDCVYVGDGDSKELPGAEAAGMHPIRLHAPDHDGAHHFDPVVWEGSTITSLADLPSELRFSQSPS
ncbi:HAD family hydrolase [Flindersiella endophytica]